VNNPTGETVSQNPTEGSELSSPTEGPELINPPEGLTMNSPTGPEVDNPTEGLERNSLTEETELKQRTQNTELSASAAEFIPRPLRDRRMPTKYEDYEVKSVRTMRAKRLHSSGISPPTGNRKDRVIWNSNLNPSDSSESEQESVCEDAKRPTTRVRILRRIRIENDTSDGEQSTVVKKRTTARIIWNSRFHSAKHEVPILYNDADNDSALASSHDFAD